ncbi:MAG: MBL fold metallo-hydrolase RNA specificity domain-containing protein [Gemmatimonadaceae bacterium]
MTPSPVPVYVRHFGGAGEVGGTSYEVRCWDVTILIDAGGRPKVRGHPYPDWTDAHVPDMALVTHAHFDHTGALPLLCRRFADRLGDFPIYTTPQTRDFAEIILADSVRVQRAQAERLAELQMRTGKGPPVSTALGAVEGGPAIAYNEEDAAAAVEALLELPFYTDVTRAFLDRSVQVTVRPVVAGHILGAAAFLVTITKVYGAESSGSYDGEYGVLGSTESQTIRLALMGDIGDDATYAIDPIDVPAILAFKPHLVVSESTYGAESLPPIEEERDRLRRAVAGVVRRGGNVIIPAFALGRSTEVALIMRKSNKRWLEYCSATGRPPYDLPPGDDPVWDLMLTDLATRWEQYCARVGRKLVPRPPASDSIWEDVDRTAMLPFVMCFIDGMARDVQVVCEHHRHALSERVQQDATNGGAILDSRYGVVLYTGKTRQEVGKRPFVVVTTSGMMTAGPVLSWIAEIGGDPLNALFLSGYQDEESPGAAAKRLVNAAPEMRVLTIDGEQYHLALEISWFRLRAHAAGQSIAQIMALLAPQHIVFAHGDRGATAALNQLVRRMLTTMGAKTATWTPKNGVDMALGVTPDRDSVTGIDLWRTAADLSGEHLMRGTNLPRIFQSLRASPRAVDTARDLALDAFGVPRDRLTRMIAIRCVTEVLEDNEPTWFYRKSHVDGFVSWEARRAATIDPSALSSVSTSDRYWDAVDIPPAEPGIAVVRYRSHYPRLALIGPHECPDGELIHPAVVALTGEQRVNTRDVVLPISGAPIGLDAWASSDKWASLMRRVLTDLQLGAEAILSDSEWRADLLERNALGASVVTTRRKAWDAVLERDPAYASLSEEGQVVLAALRDAAIGSGITTVVTLSLRQIRSIFTKARLLFPGDEYILQLRKILTGVNDARRALGMTPVNADILITHYPFDLRQILAAVHASAPSATSVSEVSLDETERIAFALYQADVFIRVTQGDMRPHFQPPLVKMRRSDAEPTFSLALSETDGVI